MAAGAGSDVYFNGTELVSATDTDSLVDFAADLYIGMRDDGYGDFDGYMDDLRIYNRAGKYRLCRPVSLGHPFFPNRMCCKQAGVLNLCLLRYRVLTVYAVRNG